MNELKSSINVIFSFVYLCFKTQNKLNPNLLELMMSKILHIDASVRAAINPNSNHNSISKILPVG